MLPRPALVTLGLALCLAWPLLRPESAPGGELQQQHQALFARTPFDATRSRTHEQVVGGLHGVSLLGIERQSPAGQGPEYTAIVSSDGTIRFAGVRHPRREGVYRGEMPRWQFDALAQFVVASGYMEYEHTYQAALFDPSTVYTLVVCKGERRCVRNHARAGPPALWAFEELLDKFLEEASWERLGDLGEVDVFADVHLPAAAPAGEDAAGRDAEGRGAADRDGGDHAAGDRQGDDDGRH